MAYYNSYIVVLGAAILAFTLMGTSCESRHLKDYILNMGNGNYPTLKAYGNTIPELNVDMSECERCKGKEFLDFMTELDKEYPLLYPSKEEQLHEEIRAVGSQDCPECQTKSELSQIYTKTPMRKRTASCMKRCLTVGYLHPSQCHSLC
ncbi:uncharacterized protein [Lepeophtheirus salmonis]|uniref:uncharacterized protein isoform X1 n=1 Tax=Lepeophtheirus salmonis TaxID=72036 RepID=UPI001AE6695D|nr:uncharacterized protein LOC121116312 [Lepeophtheirus salmonis]